MNGEWTARFLEALGRMSVQAAVLVLLVLLTQRLFRRWLTPRWRCALWLLVVARIVLPASLPTRVSVFNLFPRAATENIPSTRRSVSAGVEHSTRLSTLEASATSGTQASFADLAIATEPESATRQAQDLSAAPATRRPSKIPWPVLFFAAWLAGAAGLAAQVIVASVRVARRFRGLPEVSDPEVLAVLEECRSRMRVRTRLRLVEGAEVRSPALHGVFRPRLLLPAGFTRSFSLADLHFIFLHELAHVKRMDVLMNWVVALLQVVHWFNPLLWFGFMRWRGDRELACDALALEAAGEGRNRDYGRTILRLLEGFTDRAASPGLVGILEDKRQLQQRIGMIASFVPGKRWSLPAMLLLVGLAMIGLTDGQTPNPNDAPLLILRGKQLYESGKTNLAEVLWSAALKLDPDNEIARDYLAKIGRTNLPASNPIAQPGVPPVSAPLPRTNFVNMSKGRHKVMAMLDAISLESVGYAGLPLSEVIKAIDQEARIRDPEKRGINFLISTTLPSPPVIDPLSGLPVVGGEEDLGATIIRIAPAQKNITLRQLLDILVLVADRPIRYAVTDYGVVITTRGQEALTLYTRWYKVDPNTVVNALGANGIAPTNTVQTSPDIAITRIKAYFESLGVDLSTPPRSLVYNDRLGMLMVRATLTELEIVEQAVRRLNLVPPQVLIEAMFCKVSDDAMKTLGLDWLPGAETNSQPGPRTDASGVAMKCGFLTPQQYATVLRAMKQREDIKRFSTSKVVTVSGRQAQFKEVEMDALVRDLDLDSTTGLVPVLDVVPYIAADGWTIQMTVIPTLKEFVGYDLDSRRDTWDYVESPGANPPPARPLPGQSPLPMLPIFRLRNLVSSVTVLDGQTFVLTSEAALVGTSSGGGTNKDKVPMFGDLPFAGRYFRSESTGQKRMSSLLFITPTIIDPAGNRVHSGDAIPVRTNSMPRQIQ